MSARSLNFASLIALLTVLVWSGSVVAAIQTFKDEAGRLIYTIDDEGIVSMFESSPGIDVTLSVTRGTREQMQPKVTEVNPSSIAAGSSVLLKVKGKNLVGAAVKFDRPGIEVSPYSTKPELLEIPIRVAPNMQPGEVKVTVSTPIGATEAALKITELRIGEGAPRRGDRPRLTIPTTAPASCPDGMVGVAAESGGFCIDRDESFTADFRKAEKACSISGKRLCQANEWRNACDQARDGLPLKNMLGNWEWTGSWDVALKGDFEDPMTRSVLMGESDCQTSFSLSQGKGDVFPGRCCK
jgi:hypothetical protein